ncbi:polysaccharide pyruvyl transferase family protein [Sulfuriroseicoccus oceanibius]|uniref:Polysaccharide pyruvyl transferase family protein n=1 Tax=Sulfuriroseicoccus oceanibius TaxID=2707525 RepID=A0A6B3L9E3_9BACT|nr:polysaccharide pyruvyl transferase family protein [Sulfuriroseicoccus oceanibius]QQL45623.1 polysaccharide pyruvyl transferase family protein [Sulfuriroseicoccus oceanibius]
MGVVKTFGLAKRGEAPMNQVLRVRRIVKRSVVLPLWRWIGLPFCGVVSRILRRSGSQGVPLVWFDVENWGDALNPWLVERLSGSSISQVKIPCRMHYLAIGSVMDRVTQYSEVWGSGFIEEGQTLLAHPVAVHAVRGPLTREALRKQGVECPEVYGDPALLMPFFYDPDVSESYEYGIIPHFVDKANPWVKAQSERSDVLVIDIESGIEEFVRQLKSCRKILSSSLHGLICADAYGKPNVWLGLSDRVIGGAFKFDDYRLAIGAERPRRIDVRADDSVDEVVAHAERYPVELDLLQLIRACPFLSPELAKAVADAGAIEELRPLLAVDAGGHNG